MEDIIKSDVGYDVLSIMKGSDKYICSTRQCFIHISKTYQSSGLCHFCYWKKKELCQLELNKKKLRHLAIAYHNVFVNKCYTYTLNNSQQTYYVILDAYYPTYDHLPEFNNFSMFDDDDEENTGYYGNAYRTAYKDKPNERDFHISRSYI